MKKCIFALLLSIMIYSAFSITITLQQAAAIGDRLMRQMSGSSLTLAETAAYTSSSGTGVPEMYILNFRPAGFIILSAEEQSAPVLGYSLDSEFPLDNMSPEAHWWLDEYGRRIREIRRHAEWPVDPRWEQISQDGFSGFHNTRNVAPLCTTTWNQSEPYNLLCPEDPLSGDGHVPAGCGPLAMAQIMKRWNYPLTGTGSHIDTWTNYGILAANFGTTSYNWYCMPDAIYNEDISVETLVYHCGIAANTHYGPYGSGAFIDSTRLALINYFNYSPDVQFLNFYECPQWEELLREELDAGRPVMYFGSGPDYANYHAFILDGYDYDAFYCSYHFHVNWGWGGMHNGTYVLGALNIYETNYNYNNSALVHIHPAVVMGDIDVDVRDNQFQPVRGATVDCGNAFAVTDSMGQARLFVEPGLYNVTVSHPLYLTQTQTGVLVQPGMGTSSFIILQPASPAPPIYLYAEEILPGDILLGWWNAGCYFPADWLFWHTCSFDYANAYWISPGINYGAAVRFPQDYLASYQGFELRKVRFLPFRANCAYTVNVYHKTSAAMPGTLILSQPVANIDPNSWNTVELATPVQVPVAGDLVISIGMLSSAPGYAIGYDYGLAEDSLGNWLYCDGVWNTLSVINPLINNNWLLEAYAVRTANEYGGGREGSACQSGSAWAASDPSNCGAAGRDGGRALLAYKVYRNNALLQTLDSNGSDYYDYPDFNVPNGTYIYGVKAVYSNGESPMATVSCTVDDVGGSDALAPEFSNGFTCLYPNPASREVRIDYGVAQSSPVIVKIYNIRGQCIKTLVHEEKQPGSYSLAWDGTDREGRPAASGLYLCKLTAGGATSTRKLILKR